MPPSAIQHFSSWFAVQRYLPYRLRKSVIKRLHPAMLRQHAFSMDFFGMKLEGDIGNEIERVIYFCGAYEKYMLFFLRDYAQRGSGMVFLDIGSNIGNHALFMSRFVAQVHGFEPNPRVLPRLERNISANQIKNITVHPFGLGEEDASVPFYAPPEDKLGNGSFVEGCNPGNALVGTLEIKNGDRFLASKGVSRVDIIKLDVEGYEKQVLRGLKDTIKASRPLVVLELSAAARKAFGSEVGMRALFPEQYQFYRFKKAGRESGSYALMLLDYDLETHPKDVIACPAEQISKISL